MSFADDLDFAPEREAVKEPPKRWRNWYRALTRFCDDDGLLRAGEVYHGTRLWPSKDAAESVASEESQDERCAVGAGFSEYLGAYPEGERP